MMTTVDQLIADKATAGAKFSDDEVTPDLSRLAARYLSEYEGLFSFLVDLKAEVVPAKAWRSRAQVRGVLNCMVADVRRSLARQATVAPAAGATPASTAEARIGNGIAAVVADGLYTVVLASGEHRTLRVRTGKEDAADVQFVSFLSGSDNEADYTCCGFIRSGTYRWTKRFAGTSGQLQAALLTLVTADADARLALGRTYALESGNCFICNRTLTDPVSIATGVGPICRERNGIEPIQPEGPVGPSSGSAMVDHAPLPAGTPEMATAARERAVVRNAEAMVGGFRRGSKKAAAAARLAELRRNALPADATYDEFLADLVA